MNNYGVLKTGIDQNHVNLPRTVVMTLACLATLRANALDINYKLPASGFLFLAVSLLDKLYVLR